MGVIGKQSSTKGIKDILLFAALFFICGLVGRVMAISPEVVSPIWPPAGLALAFLLVKGWRIWPGIFIGMAPLIFLMPGKVLSTPVLLLAIFLQGAGSALQTLIGYFLLSNFGRRENIFRHKRGLIAFAFLTPLMCFLSAGIWVGTFVLLGVENSENFLYTWLTWWLSNCMGVYIITPFVSIFMTRGAATRGLNILHIKETIFVLGALSLTSGLIFGGYYPDNFARYPLEYAPVLLLIWTAIRLELRFVTLGVFLTCLSAILGTLRGYGPFYQESLSLHESLILLQVFLAVTFFTSLYVSAEVGIRKRVVSRLQKSRHIMQKRIQDRTRELSESNLNLIDEARVRKKAEENLKFLNDELEARVTIRTAELREANQDLEAFSYSISHDLRSPLRGISGFAHLLQTENKEIISDKSFLYLDRIILACKRMSKMIDDLLAFSRNTSGEFQPDMVELSSLASEVLAGLNESQPWREVDVKIQEGLSDYCDPGLVRIIFENLLGNAWKYTGKNEKDKKPRIEFARIDEGTENIYYIRDNGAGFDMEREKSMFISFQRLHSESEFEGNGIGLTTAQKLIKRHGGEIWAEGTPGEGAVFYFTLAYAGREQSLISEMRNRPA